MSFFRFVRETRFKYVIPLLMASGLVWAILSEALAAFFSTLFFGVAFGLTIAPLVLSKTDIELNETFIYPNEEVLEDESRHDRP